MNIREPIPILEKWQSSTLGKWTAKHVSLSSLYAPWPLVVFCFVPTALVVLYINDKFWASVAIATILIVYVTLIILIYAAKGGILAARRPDAGPLSDEQKQRIIDTMKHDSNK